MKLIDALTIVHQPTDTKAELFKLALVCGFTPLHLQTFLHAEMRQLFPDHRIEIVTGLFGDITGTLESLRNERIDAIALVIEWSDLDGRLGIRQLGGWGPSTLRSIVDRTGLWLSHLQELIENVANNFPVVICLPTLPLPPLFFPAGRQASSIELELNELVATFAVKISKTRRVRVLSRAKLDFESPMTARMSAKSTWASGFPYQNGHASAVAKLLALLVKNPLPKKGLITDLDNTFWQGIVGEVGADGVSWDQDNHSESHGLYQQMLQTLAEEGVLIGAASKNDPASVEEAFRRTDLILGKENISSLQVSWGSKAAAVTRILKAWNIGADSVVFIDDSELELAEVQSAHPEVECIRFPNNDAQGVYELCVRLRDLFGKENISEEDQLRTQNILGNADVDTVAGDASQGFSDLLLQQADAELVLSFHKDPDDVRAFELVNKTNQFNLNGKRVTEASWKNYLDQSNTFMLTASYKDRFGSLGKIAVMTGRLEGARAYVDTWVMSCRAFARRIEHQCLSKLYEKFELNEITFDYVSTAKNGPTQKFFSEILGETPGSAMTIARDRFGASCPTLFHHVVELKK